MQLQARFLATCPVAELRDGARALALTETTLARGRSPEKAQTLAMVCAELGRFDEAVRVQETAIELAQRSGADDLVPTLEQELQLYRTRRPCRAPWPDHHPLLEPPALTLETATLIE